MGVAYDADCPTPSALADMACSMVLMRYPTLISLHWRLEESALTMALVGPLRSGFISVGWPPGHGPGGMAGAHVAALARRPDGTASIDTCG